ncbi:DUF1574 family protein [Leptospira terpstrae]|uniref:PF07611 family protein n=1 Tax=Leptospira terpstrae serovar Hualin str. LT 11-33 = ATCC 700639 TaxID=1257025 RepID=N1VQM0_9LEPT|nr:DUF1574 family protein [Leptospira terpstrae]EMY62014.1 PF07611 family protein [Leptospira terpstrae serovar Hualin str. LT 11-33 = ATCC 700639]
MKFNRTYFLPFFILLTIFVIDKLVCIPDVRESGRRNYKAGQNILLGMPVIWVENKKIQSSGKKVAVVTGTSRSEPFHEWAEIPVNKSTIKEPVYFETRTAVKASEFLLYYLLIKSMTDSGFKPNVLFLEFSDEMLNENNIYTYKTKWAELMLHENELIDIYDSMNSEMQRDIIARLLFLGYNYHFKPVLAAKNLLTGNRVTNDTYFIGISSYMNVKRPYKPEDIGYDVSQFPAKEFQERIIDYAESRKQHFLSRFQISETETNFFKKIVDHAEKHNIPMVIWEPQIHPYYNDIRHKITKGGIFKQYIQQFVNSNSKNIRHVSLNEGNTKCTTYVDCSHVSPVCVPEIADKLLQIAKEIPNFK